MQKASLINQVQFINDKPDVQILLETDFCKEIRIVFQTGQIMKEHKAPFSIVVEVFEGVINFKVAGESHELVKGDLISLGSNVPHDLTALQDSIVRLTLSKGDSLKRVEEVGH